VPEGERGQEGKITKNERKRAPVVDAALARTIKKVDEKKWDEETEDYTGGSTIAVLEVR